MIAILADTHRQNLQPQLSKLSSLGQPLLYVSAQKVAGRKNSFADPSVRHLQIPEGTKTGNQIMAAIQKCRQLGATHMLTVSFRCAPEPDDLEIMRATALAHPDAIVIGTCPNAADKGPWTLRFRGFLSRLAFRIQTGISLKTPQCELRVYPLDTLTHLKLRLKGDNFLTEVLIKAAWAGIEIHQVASHSKPLAYAVTQYPGRSFFAWIGSLLLNVHWIMRSITPIPHRKIVSSDARQGEKISVWHPIRSIGKLLTENTSPRQLAVAGAVGVFLGTLPLIAFHTIAILFAANYFRLNKIAALTTSQLCMPPIVPALCIETGYFLRHGAFLTEVSIETLGYQALDRLFEWLIGALVLAPVLAALVGGIIFLIAHILHKKQN